MARAKKLPTVLTEAEQERLLEQPNSRYPTGERNGTMLRLMLNTELRLAEVTGLKWHDVDLTTGKLMVRQGKGSKRIVPCG
jgi:site-specific recombinase XerD